MKEVKAFVRPEEFDDMYAALKHAGFCCVTVTQCEGTGKYEDPQRAELPSLKVPFMHSEVLKLEMVAQDKDVDSIIRLIEKHGKTGRRGDGMIYISNVERAVHIRTGEEGEKILFMNTNN